MEAEFGNMEEHLTPREFGFNNDNDDEIGGNSTENPSKAGDHSALRALRRDRRIMNHLTKPSTTLVLGSKGNLRQESRVKLRYLLSRIVRRRNWGDASGVLSVLLKGTCKERSLHNNRVKYSVAMELLGHMESDRVYSKDIEDIYNLWMKKIVPKKNRPWKDRSVLFDSIVSFLMQENYDGARSSAICLSQDREADHDPVSNLILGLCYYELWYATLPIHRKLANTSEPEILVETEDLGTELHQPAGNSDDYEAISIQDANSNFTYHSDTSVVNNKEILNDDLTKKDLAAGVDPQRVMAHHQSQPQGLYINSDQMSGSEGGFVRKSSTNMQFASAFYSHGVPDALLFPIQWDPFNESIEDAMKDLQPNDDYKDAVQYLRKALKSTPGASEALLPLVQLLLLNDQVKEAFDELEKFCRASNSPFATKLKTHYFECLGCDNHEVLLASYEDILKKDPTCKHAVTRLVRSYQMGFYDPERLLEMIALHLDATFADHDIWREFASCLLKVSQGEEDRVSTCLSVDISAGERWHLSKTIPSIFVKGVSGKNWKLRCKWWLHRHFNKKLLASEMAAGGKSLMAYKAASAAHLYGPGFGYLVQVGAALKEEENPLFTVLKMHVQSSCGFYPDLSSGGSKGVRLWHEVFSCAGKVVENASGEEERGQGNSGVRKRGRPKIEEESRRRKRGRPKKTGQQVEGETPEG